MKALVVKILSLVPITFLIIGCKSEANVVYPKYCS